MARNVFTTKLSGNKDILADLDLLAEEFPVWTREALKAQEQIVENAIRRNWVSLAGGKTGDYVYDSVGQSTAIGSNGKDVVGTVGVYNIDSVKIAHGRVAVEGKRKPLNAAQIAYWVEFGTTRLRSGQRRMTGAEYNEEDLIVVAGKPFISNAFYGTLNEQQNAFLEKYQKILDTHLR